jgi:hypothetical protein
MRGPMDRPTRRHKNLRRKLDEMESRSRKPGAKQRRMRRWATSYEHLIEGADKSAAKKAAPKKQVADVE